MDKKAISLIFAGIFFMLLCVQTISGAPPVTTTQQFSVGYTISTSPQMYIMKGVDYQLNFFVYNLSDGMPVTNASVTCLFYLANNTGNVQFVGFVPYFTSHNYWAMPINAGNFSKAGEYSYGIKCNSTTLGGSTTGLLEVTYSGIESSTARSIFNIGFLGILVFLFLVTIGGASLIKTDNKTDDYGQLLDVNNMKYVKGVLFAVAWALLIAVTYISSNLSFVYLGTELFGKFFFVLFKILAWLSIPFMFLWLIWIFVNIFRDKEVRNLLDKGFPVGKGV